MGLKKKNTIVVLAMIAALAMYFGIVSISLPSMPSFHVSIGGNEQTQPKTQTTTLDQVKVELVKGATPITMNRSELKKLPGTWMMGNDEVYHNMTSPTSPSIISGQTTGAGTGILTTGQQMVGKNGAFTLPSVTGLWNADTFQNLRDNNNFPDSVQLVNGGETFYYTGSHTAVVGVMEWSDNKFTNTINALLHCSMAVGDSIVTFLGADGYMNYWSTQNGVLVYPNTDNTGWVIPVHISGAEVRWFHISSQTQSAPSDKDQGVLDSNIIKNPGTNTQVSEVKQPVPPQKPASITDQTGGLIPGGSTTSSTSTSGSSISEQTGGLIPS